MCVEVGGLLRATIGFFKSLLTQTETCPADSSEQFKSPPHAWATVTGLKLSQPKPELSEFQFHLRRGQAREPKGGIQAERTQGWRAVVPGV